MDSEKILEGLTQEERLKLLAQLIQGAEQAQEEELTLEDRVERLESLVGAGPQHQRRRRGGHGRHRQHRHHRHQHMGMGGCGCGCD